MIVNGQNGIMVHAPDHVEMVNKSFYEQKVLELKMEEDLVLEVDQRLNIVIFKIVQLIVNGHNGILVHAPEHVELVN